MECFINHNAAHGENLLYVNRIFPPWKIIQKKESHKFSTLTGFPLIYHLYHQTARTVYENSYFYENNIVKIISNKVIV